MQNIEILLNFYKKNKNVNLINMILFLTDYHFYNLKEKKIDNIERVIENNKRLKKERYSNEKLDSLLKSMKKFRKYNIQSHDEGVKYRNVFHNWSPFYVSIN